MNWEMGGVKQKCTARCKGSKKLNLMVLPVDLPPFLGRVELGPVSAKGRISLETHKLKNSAKYK